MEGIVLTRLAGAGANGAACMNGERIIAGVKTKNRKTWARRAEQQVWAGGRIK